MPLYPVQTFVLHHGWPIMIAAGEGSVWGVDQGNAALTPPGGIEGQSLGQSMSYNIYGLSKLAFASPQDS